MRYMSLKYLKVISIAALFLVSLGMGQTLSDANRHQSIILKYADYPILTDVFRTL